MCGTKFDFEFVGNQIPNAKYVWDFGVGASPSTSNQLTPSTVIYILAGNKNISLSVTVPGCNAVSGAKIISVAPSQLGFVADVSTTSVKCFGNSTGSITAIPKGGIGPYAVKWSNNATTNTIVSLAAGRYKATVTDANNCAFNVDTVVSQPSAPLGFTYFKADEACAGFGDGSITLNPTGGTVPYKVKWSTGATSLNRDSLNAGKYSFSLVDSNGCKLDSAVNIGSRCKTQKSAYDIITPNGDGNNDVLIIPNIDKYPNSQLLIYNRWGQLIYSAKGYKNDWMGTTTDGKDVLTGAYYFVVYLNDAKNTLLDGSITVIR